MATDISENMLKLASDAAREAGLKNVEIRVMDAETIDVDENSFDSVICRQGLMFFPSPAKALTAMRRVVKPEGKLSRWYGQVKRRTHTRGFPWQSFAG